MKKTNQFTKNLDDRNRIEYGSGATMIRLPLKLLVFCCSFIVFANTQAASAQETRSGAEIFSNENYSNYPWEISKGVKFSTKFLNTPKPGADAILDLGFIADDPDLQKATTSVNKYFRVVESGVREGFVYYFNTPISIENIYATLDLKFVCKGTKKVSVSSFSVHRLVKPFTSYEYKTPGSRNFETFSKEIHGIKRENLIFDDKKQVSFPIPTDCVTLYLQNSNLTIWVDYTNADFVTYGSQRFKVTSPSSRLAVTSNSNTASNLQIFSDNSGFGNILMNFGTTVSSASKTTKTPVAVKPTLKSSKSTVVKEGAKCTTAGKITNASGNNLVCAKIGSKLIWVSLSGSGTSNSAAPTPTPAPSKLCSTNSNLIRSYIGADSSQGANLTALVFENLSDCNLSVSATASFICPDGGTLKPSNALQSTGSFAVGPKQKMAITGLSVTRYFPLLSQQCFQLTGFRTNNPQIDTFYGGPLRATILTSTP